MLKKNTLTTQYRIRKVDLVERKASVPLKAVPLKAADRTRKFRVLKPRGANLRFASALRCFLSGIESSGAAVPGTKGHRKVDLVERNASVLLKATLESRGDDTQIPSPKWQRRKSTVCERSALFPQRDRNSRSGD